MILEVIHSFLVHPDEGAEAQTTIGGTEVKGKNRLVDMLTGVFMAAPDEVQARHFLHTQRRWRAEE